MTLSEITERKQDYAALAVADWHKDKEAVRVLALIAAQGEHFDCALADELTAIRDDIIADARSEFDGWQTYFETLVEPTAMGIEDAIDLALDASDMAVTA